jgi:hypothetical protein
VLVPSTEIRIPASCLSFMSITPSGGCMDRRLGADRTHCKIRSRKPWLEIRSLTLRSCFGGTSTPLDDVQAPGRWSLYHFSLLLTRVQPLVPAVLALFTLSPASLGVGVALSSSPALVCVVIILRASSKSLPFMALVLI